MQGAICTYPVFGNPTLSSHISDARLCSMRAWFRFLFSNVKADIRQQPPQSRSAHVRQLVVFVDSLKQAFQRRSHHLSEHTMQVQMNGVESKAVILNRPCTQDFHVARPALWGSQMARETLHFLLRNSTRGHTIFFTYNFENFRDRLFRETDSCP